MSLPSGVPSNATATGEETFTIPAGVTNATVRLTTQITVNNTTGAPQTVNAYVVLDLNGSSSVADALPLTFQTGQTRQEFTTQITGLAAGSHTLDLYLYSTVNGVNWVWTRFIGQIYLA